jgi:trehalose synthase
MALDDPEGWDIYNQIRAEGDRDPSLYIFTNLTGVGNIEVNAFQRFADVVVQLSTREGFGLIVSETLWKGTPVVARAVGGIPLQMQGNVGGALVKTVEECASQVVRFVRDKAAAQELGAKGRELVRERFLLTRLIADELRLYESVLGLRRPRLTPAATVGLSDETRDPVCGRLVDPATALTLEHGGRVYFFNAVECMEQFREDPDRFIRGHPSQAD